MPTSPDRPRDPTRFAADPAFALHEGGKLAIASRAPLDGPGDLSLAYTPGVGRVSQAIADDADLVWEYTVGGTRSPC